jgi:lipoic acid synthetase
VKTGRPPVLDTDEPRRVAEALSRLDLRHAVLTSVDRDELDDCGAGIWAETIRRVRESCPDMSLEVLIPDLKGRLDLVDLVLDAKPHVLAHNLETVPRLHPTVRPQAEYRRSLLVLERAHESGTLAKTGVMLGLGEEQGEVEDLLGDCAESGVDIVTLGQYLRPSKRHLRVERFVPPEEFAALAELGKSLGIRHVEAGPLVRSSYRAGSQVRSLS